MPNTWRRRPRVWPRVVAGNAAVLPYHAANSYAMTGAAPRALVLPRGPNGVGAYDSGDAAAKTLRTNGVNAAALLTIHVTLESNIFSALDRRIAVEMGCSLPVKNSPMVDHQKETPDFVLGRWILKPNLLMQTEQNNTVTEVQRFTTAVSTTVEHQRPHDRIVYHELMPQQKLQVLRVRLFARIRQFDDRDDSWNMRVIDLPTNSTDWWHARLHFVSKD